MSTGIAEPIRWRSWAGAAGLLLAAAALLPWRTADLSGALPARLGLLALPIGLIAAGAALLPERWGRGLIVLAVGAAAALVLAAAAVPATQDPRLWTIVEENRARGSILAFAARSLPANLGRSPSAVRELPAANLVERVRVGAHAAGRGAWLTVFALMLLVVAAVRARVWAVAGLVAALAAPALVAAACAGSLAAELDAWRGARRLASGDYPAASDLLARAAAASPVLALDPGLRARAGEALTALGRTGAPESLLFRARLALARGEADRALSELELARVAAGGDLRTVLERELAAALVERGLQRFARRSFAEAAADWERALRAEPGRIDAVYLLARAEHELGRFGPSAAASRRVLERVRDPLVRAGALANLGDSLVGLGDMNAARGAYASALRLDPVLNFRVLRSLGGT